jgi:hypothetical protein
MSEDTFSQPQPQPSFLPRHPDRDARRPPAASPRLSRRGLLVVALAALGHASAHAAEFREITWDDLVPKDWDPMASLKDMAPGAGGNAPGALSDSDPRTAKLYERLRDVWDNAPTVAAMAGKAVKLPGYVVPLDQAQDGMREFLLVPYFGACIHTPPPPANQIVRVQSQQAVKGLRTMSAVWVSGRLGMERAPSEMGVSGYTMVASQVVPYRGK